MRKLIALAVPIALLVAACGSDEIDAAAESSNGTDGDDLLAAAQDEGEVVLYVVPQEETVVEWAADFSAEYGVGIVTHRESQGAIWERFQQEERAGQHLADILIFNDPAVLEMAREEGWIAEFTPSTDGEFSDAAKEPGQWYPIYTSGEVLAWNTSQVSENEAAALRSGGFGALSDDEWSGRVGTLVPHATGRAYATYYELAESPDFGWDFLERLGANTTAFYESAAPLMERVVAGEHAVVVGGVDTIAAGLVLDGAPVEFMYPEPTTGSSFHMAISESAPNPQAARLFMEWATTTEALASVAEISSGIPAHDGVEDRRTISEVDWYESPESMNQDWPSNQPMWDVRDEHLQRWSEAFGYQE